MKDGHNRKRKILWYWCCLCLVPFSAFSLYAIPEYIDRRQQARPEYDYPKLSDFMLTLYSLLFFIPSRVICTDYLFKKIGDKVIPSAESRGWKLEHRQARVDRFATVVYKFIYFICATTAGYFILMKEDFFPAALGGSGDATNCFKDFPFQAHTPYLRQYYLIEAGYHLQSLLFHIVGEHRNDYIEMILHHSCACLLIFFSYVANFLRVGSLVLILHDIADVFAYGLKTAVDTSHTKVTLFMYFSLLAAWGYTRLYVFPAKVISSIYTGITMVDSEYCSPAQWSYFLGLLYILLFLHIYWYALFFLAGYAYAKTGVTQDLQHKVGGEVKARKDRKKDAAAYRKAIGPNGKEVTDSDRSDSGSALKQS